MHDPSIRIADDGKVVCCGVGSLAVQQQGYSPTMVVEASKVDDGCFGWCNDKFEVVEAKGPWAVVGQCAQD